MLDYLKEFWVQFHWEAMLNSLQRLAGVLLCLTVHETCHGLAAYALGDPTAKERNRLSLNPLHHIDWLGLAAMFLCGFGLSCCFPPRGCTAGRFRRRGPRRGCSPFC